MADEEATASFNEVASESDLGGGAYFWVYLSPQGNTKDIVKDWTVTLTQGNWSGSINSSQNPPVLQTDGLSGDFDLRVEWRPEPTEPLQIEVQPCDGTKPGIIGCNVNCASMIGLLAESKEKACYWTTWDAFCKQQ
jgi:hypothetical protein